MGLFLLTLVAISLIGILGYAVMRMAGTQDRTARHAEKKLDPFSDVTVTR
jgi:hypothetical protein